MGKKDAKVNKHKEDRLARKQAQHRIADFMKVISKANNETPLEPIIKDLSTFKKDNLEVNIACKKVSELNAETIDWVFDLTERNMKKLYENCSWGWKPHKKKEELTEETAWYLIATDIDSKNIAFSHFRFDMDFDEAVLYCYELQVEEEGRRKGLGAHMLSILDLLADKTDMVRIRLTSLKHNPSAFNFFQKHGYSEDDTSPEIEEAAHYQILSKPVKCHAIDSAAKV